uniref:Conotoxin n=1 Tax=Conus andremenezi TaxID=1077466 RepID=A0A291C1V5_9COND|nr:conotoxin [Conus andremenezi]
MKLSVTFLLILMILPSMTGEKSSKRTLRGASLRGIVRGYCFVEEPCEENFQCCSRCCMIQRCVWTFTGPCPILGR